MSSNIEIQKICQCCGKEFTAKTTVTRYCSHRCASTGYKNRVRDEKIENAAIKPSDPNLSPGQSPIINNRVYLNVQQTAELMGISRPTVNRYCASGKVPCVKINRKIFIRRKDIDALFEEAVPYQVTPLKRLPITEFYTLEEIVEKFGYSKETVYKTAKEKRIPNVLCQGKKIYSKRHVDRHFSVKVPDPDINDWYTRDEIGLKYDISKDAVYSMVANHRVPRMNMNGMTVYSKIHVDNIMQARQPNPEITEWYTLEEIVERYNLKAPYVSNLIFRNAIPKTRHGNKGYYSKKHFDALMEAKFPKPAYYTAEEATARFGISRDVLYQHIKRHNIPHEKEGRYIRISKTHLDQLFGNQSNQ